MGRESRLRGESGRPGANNWLARGEQSDPRTAENAPQNQPFTPFIGRKRFTLSALSSGEVSKGGGGVPYQHESEFLTAFTDEPSGVSGGSDATRILLV